MANFSRMIHTIRQIEEKTYSCEIVDMVWNDRMDLVAVANIKGEVGLHRLTWARAWIVSSPKKNVTVDGIAWRPDGKVIAIGYNTGKVFLISVEDKAVLTQVDTKCTITCINWVQEKVAPKRLDPLSPLDLEDQNDYMAYIDFSSMFLSEPPSAIDTTTAGVSEENKKPHILHNQTDLNILLIGTKEGVIFMNVFGCFQCISLNLCQRLGFQCSIENIHLTEDLSQMFVTVKDSAGYVRIVAMDTSIFKTHKKELFAIAMKYVRLQHLVDYMSSVISTIKETWESILLEMDTKLSNYASKVAEGGVTADFLDLLMFGACSAELEEFLLKDLTKKGLEKFGQTIEVSYCNIQKLLLKYLIKYGQNITYQLAELRGMARLEYRYGVFGISEDLITKAIQASGLYLVKGCEVQQIINQSIINYKAFIRWLYTAIMHMMEEPIPSEIPKMTQQDLAYIIDFLQNFDHIGHKNEPNKKLFVMERIGQYLAEEPLTIPPDMESNEWSKFLEQNKCIKNNPIIFEHFTTMSLIQQYKHLKDSVEKIFLEPKDQLETQLKVTKIYSCFHNDQEKMQMTVTNCPGNNVLYAFVQEKKFIDLVHFCDGGTRPTVGRFSFPQHLSYEVPARGDNYTVLDAKFYSSGILSILLQEVPDNRIALIYQFSVPHGLNSLGAVESPAQLLDQAEVVNINGSEVYPKVFRTIEGMTAFRFAVSGSRRVSIVIADNRRRLKLFEMEGEEEDDEDADMTSSTIRETDTSMQDSVLVE